MKTMKQWHESKLNFESFITPGDEIDSELFWYFLEVLPPRKQMAFGFLVGEPTRHDPETGEGMLDAFYESPDGKRFFYGGLKTVKQFINPDDPKFYCNRNA